jgi:hypothetical protein
MGALITAVICIHCVAGSSALCHLPCAYLHFSKAFPQVPSRLAWRADERAMPVEVPLLARDSGSA